MTRTVTRSSMCRRTSGSRASNSFDTFSSDSSESHSSAPPPGPKRRSGPRCVTHHFVCLLVFPLFDCCLFLSNRGLCLYGNERGGSQRAELFDAGPAAKRRREASPGQEAGGWGFKEGKVHCGNPSLCSVLCSRTTVTFDVPVN